MVRSREFVSSSSSSSSSDSDSSSDDEFSTTSNFENSLPSDERGLFYAKLLFVLALGKGSTYLYRIIRVTLELFNLLPVTQSRKMLFYAELEFHFYQIYFLSRLPSKIGSQARAKRIFLDFFAAMIKQVCEEIGAPVVREFTILYMIGFEERKDALGDVNITLDSSKLAMADSDVNFAEHRSEALTYAARYLQPGFDFENCQKLVTEKGFRFSKKTSMPSSLHLISSTIRRKVRDMSQAPQQQPAENAGLQQAINNSCELNTPIIEEVFTDENKSDVNETEKDPAKSENGAAAPETSSNSENRAQKNLSLGF